MKLDLTSVVAVSYTHLDVYKRQLQERTSKGNEMMVENVLRGGKRDNI